MSAEPPRSGRLRDRVADDGDLRGQVQPFRPGADVCVWFNSVLRHQRVAHVRHLTCQARMNTLPCLVFPGQRAGACVWGGRDDRQPRPHAGSIARLDHAVRSASSPRTGPRHPLPVAWLFGARERSTVYGLTTVDARGRVADRMVTRALGWQPGNPLSIRVTDSLIIGMAADDGQLAVSS